MSSNQEWLNSLRRYTGDVFRNTDDYRWPAFESPYYPRRPLNIEVEIHHGDGRSRSFSSSSLGRRRGRTFSNDDIVDVTAVHPEIETNCRAHRSDRFSGSRHGDLIVRRGQAFQIVIQLASRNFRADSDELEFEFTYKGTRYISGDDGVERVKLSTRAIGVHRDADIWSAQLTEIQRSAIAVEITPSSKSAVGEWKLNVLTRVAQRRNLKGKVFSYDRSIFILFNPWNHVDQVYLSNSKDREEYVLNDTGIIYSGRKDRIAELPWVFGQHERNVLQIVLYAIKQIADLDVHQMADAVQVARAISSIINGHRGRDGIVEGNWSEKFHDFEDSRSPWEWSSSVEILQLFNRKKSIVRYGQCFVFAGVCNTLCRALGIPARCITNYRSAHDVHGNLVLDYILDENDKMVSEKRNDSIWSFHVWNEVWMKRDDLNLPGDFHGWQVIDATPQEISNGEYRVGPASVKAIRRGEVEVDYDVAFVLSEVNADVVYFRKSRSGYKKEIKRLIDDVGHSISTKGVRNNQRMDITNNYKPREGSSEERQIYQRALRKINPHLPRFSRAETRHETEEDVSFELKKINGVQLGDPVQIKAVAKNHSFDAKYNVRLIFKISSKTYAGTHEKVIKIIEYNELLHPKDAMEFNVPLEYVDYAEAVKEGQELAVQLQALVLETDKDFVANEEFSLEMPQINVMCDSNQKVGRTFTVKLSLRNPLPVMLSNAEFVIEAPGITKRVHVKPHRPPAPNEHFSVETQLIPKGFGKRNLVITFNCDQIHQISAMKQIYVLS